MEYAHIPIAIEARTVVTVILNQHYFLPLPKINHPPAATHKLWCQTSILIAMYYLSGMAALVGGFQLLYRETFLAGLLHQAVVNILAERGRTG